MNIFFLLKEGIIGLKRARLAAFISVVSVSLSLTLLGIFAVAGQNVKDIFIQFYKQFEVEVFLESDISTNRINQLEKQLQNFEQVSEVTFISSKQALEEFEKTFGEEVSGVLQENPLPPSFRIVLKTAYSTPDNIQLLSDKITGLSGVQEVIYQKEVIQFIHKYFGLALIVAGFLAIVLLIVITILVFNTIRLTIHARTEIIQIMKLVGATNLFIKSPFIIEGIIQGIIGGAVAVGIIMLFVNIIQNTIFPQISILPHIYLIIMGMGLLLGLMGSYISVNKYLKY